MPLGVRFGGHRVDVVSQLLPQPLTPALAWPPSLPSVPTSRASDHFGGDPLRSTCIDGVLNERISFSSRVTARQSPRSRPGTSAMLRPSMSVGCHRVDRIGKVLHVPRLGTAAWPPSRPRADFTRDACYFGTKRSAGPGVDGVLSSRISRALPRYLARKTPLATAVVTSQCCAPALSGLTPSS